MSYSSCQWPTTFLSNRCFMWSILLFVSLSIQSNVFAQLGKVKIVEVQPTGATLSTESVQVPIPGKTWVRVFSEVDGLYTARTLVGTEVVTGSLEKAKVTAIDTSRAVVSLGIQGLSDPSPRVRSIALHLALTYFPEASDLELSRRERAIIEAVLSNRWESEDDPALVIKYLSNNQAMRRFQPQPVHDFMTDDDLEALEKVYNTRNWALQIAFLKLARTPKDLIAANKLFAAMKDVDSCNSVAPLLEEVLSWRADSTVPDVLSLQMLTLQAVLEAAFSKDAVVASTAMSVIDSSKSLSYRDDLRKQLIETLQTYITPLDPATVEKCLSLSGRFPDVAAYLFERICNADGFNSLPLLLRCLVWQRVVQSSTTPEIAYDSLAALVTSKDETERQLAQEALCTIVYSLRSGKKSVASQGVAARIATDTCKMLTGEDPELKRFAIQMASKMRPPSDQIIEHLVAIGRNAENDYQDLAMACLERMLNDKSPSTEALAIRILSDNKMWPPTLQVAAVIRVSTLPPADAIKQLSGLITQGEETVRAAAMLGLPLAVVDVEQGSLCPNEYELKTLRQEGQSLLPLRHLVISQIESSSALVRRAAIVRAMRMPNAGDMETSEIAIRGLTDREDQVKDATLRSLSVSDINNQKVAALAREATHSNSALIRNSAYAALLRLGESTPEEIIRTSLDIHDSRLLEVGLSRRRGSKTRLDLKSEEWKQLAEWALSSEMSSEMKVMDEVLYELTETSDSVSSTRNILLSALASLASPSTKYDSAKGLLTSQRERYLLLNQSQGVIQIIARELRSGDKSRISAALQLVSSSATGVIAPELVGDLSLLLNSDDEAIRFQSWCAVYMTTPRSPSFAAPASPFEEMNVWPPPPSSTGTVLSLTEFKNTPKTYGDTFSTLCSVLERARFKDREVKEIENSGFVVWTRAERIDDLGNSLENEFDRFSIERKPLRSLSVTSWLSQLFLEEPGQFRLFLFVVSQENVHPTGKQFTARQLLNGLHSTSGNLSRRVSDTAVGDSQCHVFVYVFRKESEHRIHHVPQSKTLQAVDHLKKAGISFK